MSDAERLDGCERCGQAHAADGACDPAARIGEVLGDKYRVVRFIGQGGMGSVYEAQHTVVGRRFAVKLLHRTLSRRPDLLARFRREAQAAGSLESENIASVIDFGHAHDGLPYLVMELLAGADLARILEREGPLPVGRAVDIVIQTCRGLDAAHAAGIVHRDLKPENLFVSQRGDGRELVKILDFGIAKLSAGPGPAEGSVTRTGATLGTPFYMSPEQARGEKELDHRADIYALGVILFEVLSGEKPHTGESYNAILYHILMRPPLALDACRPGLPAGLARVVHRALAVRPDERQPSATELARELAPFAGREHAPAQSRFELRAAGAGADVGGGGGGGDEASGGAVATVPSEPVARAGRGRRVGLIAGAAVVCVLGGGSLGLLARSRAPEGAGAPPVDTKAAVARPAGVAPRPAAARTAPAEPPHAAAEPVPRPLGESARGASPPAPAVASPPALAEPAGTFAMPGTRASGPSPETVPVARRVAKRGSASAHGAGQRPPAAGAAGAAVPAPAPAAVAPPAAEPPAPRRPAFDRTNPYQ